MYSEQPSLPIPSVQKCPHYRQPFYVLTSLQIRSIIATIEGFSCISNGLNVDDFTAGETLLESPLLRVEPSLLEVWIPKWIRPSKTLLPTASHKKAKLVIKTI